jgi:hypothetical protein
MNATWKKMSDNGYLSAPSKTHLLYGGKTTACGKVIPRNGADVEYEDSCYTDCKICAQAYAKHPEAY